MEQLPAELRIEVLRSIDDFSTLYSFIRVSKSLYSVFSAAKSSILSSVLERSIPIDILTDALAVHSSSLLPVHDDKLTKDFVASRWLGNSSPTYPPSQSAGFGCLAHFQHIIDWFTNDICKTFARNEPSLGVGSFPVSFEERVRISRAFYRIEIYCNLFKDTRVADDMTVYYTTDDQFELFLSHIPPWEVEEVACVHEYLHNKLSVLDEAVREYEKNKNMDWGFWADIRKDRLRPNSMKEMVLSHGLELLYKLFSANPPNVSVCGTFWFRELDEFLGRCLLLGDILEHEPCPSGFAELFSSGGIKGPSPGWLWANANEYTSGFGSRNKRDIREWGYCLWSKSRLQRSRLIEKPWDTTKYWEWKLRWEIRGAAKSNDPKTFVEECREIDDYLG
ncbi:hypothetical protein MMC30_001285 [Trapelia coarctata]|nr:hypothetical protein [Trapelia coarctata]